MSLTNSILPTRTLLVILAHPDDESFPMGGTLAKYAAAGVRVILLCATHGEAGIPGWPPEKTARVREHELRAAAEVLKLAEVRFLDYCDGQLLRADPPVIIGQLVTTMLETQPDGVITFGPDGISGHPDHVAIHHFTTSAFDQAGLPGRLFYLAPSEATQQGCGIIPPQEIAGGPVAAIDIGDYRVTKVRAMQCHASQNPPYLEKPEEEAQHLACHEFFTLARPVEWQVDLINLFEVEPTVAVV